MPRCEKCKEWIVEPYCEDHPVTKSCRCEYDEFTQCSSTCKCKCDGGYIHSVCCINCKIINDGVCGKCPCFDLSTCSVNDSCTCSGNDNSTCSVNDSSTCSVNGSVNNKGNAVGSEGWGWEQARKKPIFPEPKRGEKASFGQLTTYIETLGFQWNEEIHNSETGKYMLKFKALRDNINLSTISRKLIEFMRKYKLPTRELRYKHKWSEDEGSEKHVLVFNKTW